MILQYFSIKVMYVQNLLNLRFPLSFFLVFCKKVEGIREPLVICLQNLFMLTAVFLHSFPLIPLPSS